LFPISIVDKHIEQVQALLLDVIFLSIDCLWIYVSSEEVIGLEGIISQNKLKNASKSSSSFFD